MSEENKALVQRWFDEVWNAGRSDAIDELTVSNLRVNGLTLANGDPVSNREAFKRHHNEFIQTFPRIRVEIEDMVAEGDKVAVRCVVHGVHRGDTMGPAPTNKPVEFSGIVIIRFENGKIAEGWNNFDFLRLFQQIGKI